MSQENRLPNLNNASRREFIRSGGFAAAGWVFLPKWIRRLPTPFIQGYPLHNIPANKNIDPKWLTSLYQRGAPTSYLKTKNELKYIGMPAGGLHTGSLYLGGDGRLWLWEIYNDDKEGITPKTVQWFDGEKQRAIRNRDGANYVSPALAKEHRKLDQGFAIKIQTGGSTHIKYLKEDHWDEICFTATYPQAQIVFTSKSLPLKVTMQAGAFYIPLREDDSSLPATSISIECTNTGTDPMEVTVLGWLENGVGIDTCKTNDGSIKKSASFQLASTPGAATGRGILHSADLKNPDARDAGTMCLTLMEPGGKAFLASGSIQPRDYFSPGQMAENEHMTTGFPEKLTGLVVSPSRRMGQNQSIKVNYAISWHFNHPLQKLNAKMPENEQGYYYGQRFKDALAVTQYIAMHYKRLIQLTRLWQETYYDSSLPHWLLERAVINTGTIATANTYRLASGRFWGWEGVNACEGTCTHVWQYGHALARLFPALERDTRQRVDLGVALLPSGGIAFRGEFDTRPAIDGQAGTILRFYREHQMSPDYSFLQHNWPNIKKALQFLIAQDRNGDGMTDTPMENTLDAVWEGEIAWIVGLSIAAIKAGQYMAAEMQDSSFEAICMEYVKKGIQGMEEALFNGEYFIHRPDKTSGRKKLGSYNTCHIDQVYGQSWAFQVGLGRLWDASKTTTALKSLWKYNFAPDVGPYIKTHIGGRPYALAGEAGLIMNTNPHNEPHPYGENVSWQLGYFHECMSGFEHQVAAHMMAENMTDESLIIIRSIHDRYHAAKRNPYNEIECSDHYTRAMASYGTFITTCGYYYHGPKGIMGFSPRLSPNDFKAAFTAAEGWGSYQQLATIKDGKCTFRAEVHIKYGRLRLTRFQFELPELMQENMSSALQINVMHNTREIYFSKSRTGSTLLLTFPAPISLEQEDQLHFMVS